MRREELIFTVPLFAIVEGVVTWLVLRRILPRSYARAGDGAWRVWSHWMASSIVVCFLGYALWPTWYAPDQKWALLDSVFKIFLWCIAFMPAYFAPVVLLLTTPSHARMTMRLILYLMTVLTVSIVVSQNVLRIGQRQRTEIRKQKASERAAHSETYVTADTFRANKRQLTDRDRERLFGGQFRQVDVGNVADFGDIDLVAIDVSRLEVLDLGRTRVTDDGLIHLRNAQKLQSLSLYEATSVTDKGVAHLVGLQELSSLDLSGTSVTDAAIDVLENLPRRDVLVSADRTQVTAGRLAQFRLKRVPRPAKN